MTRSQESGYALFLAATVVAILALVLLSAARIQDSLRPGARVLSAPADEAIAAETLTARIAFTLLTEPIGSRSVVIGGARETQAGEAAMGGRELHLDGRAYAAGPGVLASLQDEAGLLDLNAPDEAASAQLLAGLGVRAMAARRLAASLADYVDGDDLRRASGAEDADYARGGLQAPPNRGLARRWETLDVIGWRDALGGSQRAALWRLTAVNNGQRPLNVNTAPVEVLAAVLGDAAAARALTARRSSGAIRDLQEVEALTGPRQRAAGAALASSPGATFRLLIAFENGRAVERRLAFSGPEAERPIDWSEERRGRFGAERRQDSDEQTEPLPYATALSAP